jgi:hypothetical protein
MNTTPDLVETIRVTLDAVDLLVEHALRTSGTVEAQQAARLAQRARHTIDALVQRAIAEAS